MIYKYKGVKIEKGVHNTIKLSNSVVVFIDPFRLEKSPELVEPADLVLCSHHHFDHFSPEDINKIISDQTEVLIGGIPDAEVLNSLGCKIRKVIPSEVFTVDDVKVQTTPAYNVDKFKSPGVLYHPKEENGVGFVVTVDDVKVYYAGDTDKIPEMATLRNIEVAFLPVSGKYVMTANEAVAVAQALSPKVVIPIHYGEIVGNVTQAEELKKLCSKERLKVEVVIL